MSKVYKNQPLSVDIPFDVGDITGCPVECELFAPGVVGTPTETIDGDVVDGPEGTAEADILAGVLDIVGDWRAQPYVTKGGSRWPAEVTVITVTELGSVK